MHVILRPLLRYADFSGRASRSEYWLFGLFQLIIFVCLIAVSVMSFGGLRTDHSGAIGGFLLSLGLIILVALGLFIPNLAVLARRMHDINLPVWFLTLLLPGYMAQGSNIMALSKMFQASAIGADQEAINQAVMSSMATTGALSMIAMLCNLALFVIVLIPGNKGSNRYGDDPKGGSGLGSRLPTGPTAKPAFDEARIDAAIADLKTEKPYKPVFDFGPETEDRPMIATRDAQPAPAAPVRVTPPAPVTRYGVTDAKPTFGRRR